MNLNKEGLKTLIFALSSAFLVTWLSAWLTNDSTASYISGVVTYWGALIFSVIRK